MEQVFNRPLLTKENKRQDYGERRWITIEELNAVVVFPVRKNVIQIISARKANKNERSDYSKKIEK